MAVLMPEPGLLLGVQERVKADDGHGYSAPTDQGALRGPWPARARRRADGGWALALDPAAWPVKEGDVVVQVVGDAPTRKWVVVTAEQWTNNVAPDADYVAVDAKLEGAGPGAGATATP